MKTRIINFLFNSLNPSSLLHGLYTALISFILGGIVDYTTNGGFPTTVQLIVIAKGCIGVTASYLLKNGFAGSSNKADKPANA